MKFRSVSMEQQCWMFKRLFVFLSSCCGKGGLVKGLQNFFGPLKSCVACGKYFF